jgi:hypothetical protein
LAASKPISLFDDPNQIVVLQKYGRRYRNFYKIEKWSRDGQRVEEMLFAWNSLANTQRHFERSSRNDQVEANDQATNSRIEEVSSVASLE